jgi:long-chain acyl-CoA synthetase
MVLKRTLCHLLENSAEKYGNNILLWEKQGTSYQGSTYLEVRETVHLFAAALMAMGIQKGDRIALISEGRNDWVISELGILYAGAVNVPLSVKLEASDLKFRIAHSGCKMAIVSGRQAPKIQAIKKDLPDLEWVILLDALADTDEDEITIQNLWLKGKEYLASHSQKLQDCLQHIQENDPVNICYTSGTTADPKGIILSHRNYTANVEQASALLPIPEDYISLLILPWDHSFAHTAGIYTLMKNGASMASVELGDTPLETLRNIPKNIKEIKPSFLLSVPALAENFRKNIEKGIRQKGPRVEKLFNRALKLAAYYYREGINKGKGGRTWAKPLVALYDRILFSKIREGFGGKLEFFIGGGALLDIELQRFFYAIGIPMLQGYGLTEAAPIISANVPACHKLGTSGQIVKNLDVRILDDAGKDVSTGHKGEIVVKGENVMLGYWKNEKATKETLRDGWLYTGDIGYMDEDGFLYVLGRVKSLLISNDGEKYSPEGIEEALVSFSPYIDQVMLHNNQDPYTVALIVPNREKLLLWMRENELSHHKEEGRKAVLEFIQSELDRFRDKSLEKRQFPSKWLPAAVAILGESFNEENRFLNSTLKMVRGRITDYYRNRIDYLYTSEGKNIVNHQNMTIIGRLDE